MLTDELRSIPVFKNLTDSQRERVAERLQEVEVDLGAVLARQGDSPITCSSYGRGRPWSPSTESWSRRSGRAAPSAKSAFSITASGQNVVAATPMRLLTMTVWDFDGLAGPSGVRRPREDHGAVSARAQLNPARSVALTQQDRATCGAEPLRFDHTCPTYGPSRPIRITRVCRTLVGWGGACGPQRSLITAASRRT